MRPPALIAINLTLLFVVVVAILLTPEPAGVAGAQHERFATMSVGGDGPARHDGVYWLGCAFAALTLCLASALMALGVERDGSLRGIARPLIACLGINVLIWVWLAASYVGYANGESSRWFLALPAPTAILVYVLYPATSLFNLLYVVGYRRFVLSASDVEAYQRLVERRARRS